MGRARQNAASVSDIAFLCDDAGLGCELILVSGASVAYPAHYPDSRCMADAVHVCQRHFVRLFHARYGLPPGRFQPQNRLRKARKGMAAGDHSLA